MAKIRKSPSYLLQVGTIYHFRYVIPSIYDAIASGELRISLGTGRLAKARPKASVLAKLASDYLKEKMRGYMKSNTKAEIKAALGKYLRGKLEEQEEVRLQNPPLLKKDRGKILSNIGEIVDYHLKAGSSPAKVDVYKFLEGLSFKGVSKESELYKYVERELYKMYQAWIEIEKERVEGRYNSQIEHAILAVYPETVTADSVSKTAHKKPVKARSKRLSQAIEQFVRENVSDGKWSKKSIIDYKDRLKILSDIMGDPLMSEIDRKKTRQFFDSLKKIPANKSKIRLYRDKSIDELLEMDLPRDKCLSDQTINNTMQAASNFFNWAVKGEILSQNYASGMKMKIDRRPDEIKDAFSKDDLKTIFNWLSEKDGHRYWIVLIALYTGARLEEVCQLTVNDVREIDGIWVIDINDSGEKDLKTKNSKRLIPIHSVLIEKGLLNLVKRIEIEGKQRLFYELKKVGTKFGHSITKWFSTHLKTLGIRTDDHNVSFHSLRHTFINTAKQSGLGEEYVAEIVGHSKGITYGIYGKKYHPSILKEVIDKISFDI